jgi:hypothetical protein
VKREKLYEDYLDDVEQDELKLQDEQPTSQFDPTWMIKVSLRDMSKRRK